MKTFSMTDAGRRRDMNQDYMFASDAAVGKLPNLFIVADGMGGLVNSDQVSSSLVETMLDAYAPGGEEDPQRTLRALLQQAVFSIKSLLEANTYQSGSTLIS